MNHRYISFQNQNKIERTAWIKAINRKRMVFVVFSF